MGIDIAALVKTAFTTVDGIVDGVVEACSYKYCSGDPTYNATTGVYDIPTTTVTVSAIRKKLTIKDSLAGGVYGIPEFQIKSDDRVYLIPRSDLGRLPTKNDKMTLSTGETLSVVAFGADPKITGALLTVVLRRP